MKLPFHNNQHTFLTTDVWCRKTRDIEYKKNELSNPEKIYITFTIQSLSDTQSV